MREAGDAYKITKQKEGERERGREKESGNERERAWEMYVAATDSFRAAQLSAA